MFLPDPIKAGGCRHQGEPLVHLETVSEVLEHCSFDQGLVWFVGKVTKGLDTAGLRPFQIQSRPKVADTKENPLSIWRQSQRVWNAAVLTRALCTSWGRPPGVE